MKPFKTLVIVSTIVLTADSCSDFIAENGSTIVNGAVLVLACFVLLTILLANKKQKQ